MENYINNFSKKLSNEKYNILCGWNKFSLLFSRKDLKFLKIKITNNNPITDIIKSPAAPISTKISK